MFVFAFVFVFVFAFAFIFVFVIVFVIVFVCFFVCLLLLLLLFLKLLKESKHTIEKHLKHDTNQTIYGVVVRQEHAASRLIVPAKHNHQFFSMVNIPTNELILVKLN